MHVAFPPQFTGLYSCVREKNGFLCALSIRMGFFGARRRNHPEIAKFFRNALNEAHQCGILNSYKSRSAAGWPTAARQRGVRVGAMHITETAEGVRLERNPYLDLGKSFDCGQAFRFESTADGYAGVVGDLVLRIREEPDSYLFRGWTRPGSTASCARFSTWTGITRPPSARF